MSSWVLKAIEDEADARAYRRLEDEGRLTMEVGYVDDQPLRWFLFPYDCGEDEAVDHIAVWKEDDLLAEIAATMVREEDLTGAAFWRDRTAARLRVFADRVAALPLPRRGDDRAVWHDVKP